MRICLAFQAGSEGGKRYALGTQDVAKEHDTDIVAALHEALALRVGRKRYDLWFGDKTHLSWQGEERELRIEAPSQFLVDWLRTKFRPDLEICAASVLGTPAQLNFCVRLPSVVAVVATEGPAVASCPSADNSNAQAGIARSRHDEQVAIPLKTVLGASAAAATPPQRPGVKQRRRFASLRSFEVGDGNRLAHTSATLMLEHAGGFDSLLIHGPSGVGKTHLLEGLWSAARRREVHAVYLSAEQFTTLFLDALRGSGIPSFRRKYRDVSLLMIDDVQFFAGKRATITELLFTIDSILRDGRQIVVSADRPLSQLGELGAELHSRLQGGMVCPMHPPEQSVRRAIVANRVNQLELRVPDEVQQYIATRLTANPRELAGALHRLHAVSLATKGPITLDMAQAELAEMVAQSNPVIRLEDIEAAVCDTFGVQARDLRGGDRSKSLTQPRMLAMWLARKYTRAPLSEIGRYFGRRSHSTVLSAQRRVDGWVESGTTMDLSSHRCHVDEAIRRVESSLRVG